MGCRKGSDLARYINTFFADGYADGTMQQIAETYGLEDALLEQGEAETFTPDEERQRCGLYPGEGHPGGGYHRL